MFWWSKLKLGPWWWGAIILCLIFAADPITASWLILEHSEAIPPILLVLLVLWIFTHLKTPKT